MRFWSLTVCNIKPKLQIVLYGRPCFVDMDGRWSGLPFCLRWRGTCHQEKTSALSHLLSSRRTRPVVHHSQSIAQLWGTEAQYIRSLGWEDTVCEHYICSNTRQSHNGTQSFYGVTTSWQVYSNAKRPNTDMQAQCMGLLTWFGIGSQSIHIREDRVECNARNNPLEAYSLLAYRSNAYTESCT